MGNSEDIAMKTWSLVLTIGVLAGCVPVEPLKAMDAGTPIIPVVQPNERRAALAEFTRVERRQYCRSEIHSALFSTEARISGAIDRSDSNAQKAGSAVFKTVERWYAGHDEALIDLREMLAEGAQMQAFTKVLPYHEHGYPGYNPMNEPMYEVANFLIALAHAYAILDDVGEDKELLAQVKPWGDRLFEITNAGKDDFIGKLKGVDRRVLIAQGWAHWGNLTGNREAIDAAYRYYIHAMRSIGTGGRDIVWRKRVRGDKLLYYRNLTYGPALATAYALRRSGVPDVYEVAPRGGTLVEGITSLWDALLKRNPSELMRIRADGSRAVAWIELFIREFPGHPTTKKMEKWLSAHAVPRYAYTNGGGPSTCLYRRISDGPSFRR